MTDHLDPPSMDEMLQWGTAVEAVRAKLARERGKTAPADVSWLGSSYEKETSPAPAALRYNDGKPQLSYLLTAPRALAGLASVFEYGASKYAKHNWQKGLDRDALVDSLLRHLIPILNGESIDPESGRPHTFHVLWNALVLAEQHSPGEEETG